VGRMFLVAVFQKWLAMRLRASNSETVDSCISGGLFFKIGQKI